MALQVGERIGDYQVIAILGAGGMGKVYKVRNTISERVEAMKVLLPNLQSDPELADRFMREIKVQASLEHPNIASLHTALRIDNQLLMVMEFVEGQAIEERLQPGPLPIDAAIDYVSQVLLALAYAHGRGIIHRDIKPANMMLTPAGVVKLMDFGIARMTQEKKLTQTGATVGSLYYMSPEQIQGVNLDARSDLYSLGISLYEMVTGRRPFQGDSDYSIMSAHLQQEPVPPLQLDPRLPAVLNEIILMSIAKDPARRFQSADAFRAALTNVRRTLAPGPAGPAVAAAAPRVQPVAPPETNRRGLYLALGSVLTLVVLGLAAFQLPKLFKTSAAGESVTQPVATAPVTPPSADPAVPPPAALPETPAPAGSNAAPPIAASPERTVARPPVSVPRSTRKESSTPVSSAAAPAQVAAEPAPVQQQSRPAAPPPPVAPPVDNARNQAVAAQQERMMQMAARVNSARTSLAGVQRAQQSQGLGLRGDITAANARMEYQMDQAEAAIKAQDPAAAKRSLDAAERDLEKLETFLGR